MTAEAGARNRTDVPTDVSAAAATLLKSVRELGRYQSERRLTAFRRLHNEWAELKKRQLLAERARAPRFNVFRLLRLQRSEVGLHSRLLCDLLNPYGSHGQGALFLRPFLDRLAESRPELLGDVSRTLSEAPDPDEWSVESERARIDISIRHARLIIFIENKIDAAEQPTQLCRYRKLLVDECRISNKRGALVFLAPESYPNPTSGKPDVHLTYERDVERWLLRAIEHQSNVLPTNLRSILGQYHDLIRDMRRERMMSDSAELVDLLIKPENIRCALEISKAIEDVKRRLSLSFWQSVAADLTDAVGKESSIARSWTVIRSGQLRKETWSSREGVLLVPTEPQGATHLRVGVLEEGDNIFLGIVYSNRQPNPHPLEEIRALREAIALELRSGPNTEWLGWLQIETKNDDFFYRVAENSLLAARSISNLTIDFFRNHLDGIQAAESALSSVATQPAPPVP